MVRLRNWLHYYWPMVLFVAFVIALLALVLLYPRGAEASTPAQHPVRASSMRDEHPVEPSLSLDDLNANRNVEWSAQLDTGTKAVTVHDPKNKLTCFASPIYNPQDQTNAAGFTVTCVDRSAMGHADDANTTSKPQGK